MSVIGPLFWFIAILALIPLSLWLLKRSPYGAALGAGAAQTQFNARVVGSTSLGPGQRIVTVEVGEGESRTWLLLGVTPQQITALHTLPPQADAVAPVATPGFASMLANLGVRARSQSGSQES